MRDLEMSSSLFDACRLAIGRDALIRWRALFEPCELDCPPHGWRPSSLMRPDVASLVLGPFAGTKGPPLPGRNPVPQYIMWIRELGNRPSILLLPIPSTREPVIMYDPQKIHPDYSSACARGFWSHA